MEAGDAEWLVRVRREKQRQSVASSRSRDSRASALSTISIPESLELEGDFKYGNKYRESHIEAPASSNKVWNTVGNWLCPLPDDAG